MFFSLSVGNILRLKVFGHIGIYSRGRPATTVIEQMEGETGLSRQDLACHGQQTEMGQTCKISAGASEKDG